MQELFRSSYVDESLFPPRCCRQEIPIDLQGINLFLPKSLRDRYQERLIEHNTTDRTYCATPNCSKFIPPSNIISNLARCADCHRSTCTRCKRGHHNGACRVDRGLEQALELAAQEGWRRCNGCQNMVELAHGCSLPLLHGGASTLITDRQSHDLSLWRSVLLRLWC